MSASIPNAPKERPPKAYDLGRRSARCFAVTVAPDCDIDPGPLFLPYIADVVRLSGTLGSSTLRLAVSAWLHDVVLINRGQESGTVVPQLLIDSGLFAAVKGGTVVSY